ncbi:MAG TPA: hypothetical protein ENJ80_02345 [Gammaproteobacteria bacterium]|nr:hypothetical protein [Gammaproteobacteria bacterium]
MNDLRLILLLFGAGVILAIYAWTRFQARPRKTRTRAEHHPAPHKLEPDEPGDDAIEKELARMEQLISGLDAQPVSADVERLLVISVVAPQGGVFAGAVLRAAFEHNKLQFGEHGIFHRITFSSGRELSVFGVANLVKPGSFEPEQMNAFSTPGITLFLQLPGPLDAVETFDDFVHTAERLAVELGGELRDQKQCVLTHQALMQIREGIVEDQFRRKVAS